MKPNELGEGGQVFAHAGDAEPFAALVYSHQSMVYSLALHFLRDAALAEDVAQDVFLELYTALPALQGGEHVQRWLRRVTCNRCIDVQRRQRVRSALPLDEARDRAEMPGEADLLLQRHVREVAESLPGQARAILLLRYQEELSPAEIGQTLDVPLNTVRSQLHRALTLMRRKLEQLGVSR